MSSTNNNNNNNNNNNSNSYNDNSCNTNYNNCCNNSFNKNYDNNNPGRPAKRICESRTEQQYLIRPAHMNHYGRLFGGDLLRWIDELAGIVARRHANANITTAAIDNLQFKAPVYAGQMLVLVGHVTYVGSTSMEVRVDTYTEDLDGIRRVINRAYIVMVAIDDNGKPIPIPDIIVENEEDKMEYEAAKKRRDMRKMRRAEGF